ncbi:MAG: flagellar basal body rod protein FlgB [Oscillospiraceae bacterium]|nr:flagellar basal body rod protein FlgB [Oscillospiraceae bacterium]
MGLFETGAHSLAEQALDATWYKQRVINHNIANVDTPDFKAKTVNFDFILREAKCRCKYHGGIDHDDCHGYYGKSDEEPLKLSVITTYETNTNQILDGNNVDMEKEQMALADAQYQYDALIDYLNHNYSMIRKAINKN